MSTGDQTEYIRGKLAQRGTSQATFMKDGFDRWAESEAPARAGQMEKIPAETQMAGRGGAMTVSQAKRYDAQYGGAAVIKPLNLHGGRSFLGIEIPEQVEKAIEIAEKIFNFIELVSKKLPEIKESIQDEVIDNMDDPSLTDTDRKNAKAFLDSVITPGERIFTKIKAVLDYAKQLKAVVGAGRRGGASASDTFKKAVDYLKSAYTTLKGIYDWFRTYGKAIIIILKLRPLQPIGKEILDKLNPFLTLVGLNTGKGSGRHRCGCDDGDSSEEECMRGGAYGLFGEEYGSPMMASTEMVPYSGNQGMFGESSGKRPSGQSYGSLGMDYGMAQGPSNVKYSPPPSKDLRMNSSMGVPPSNGKGRRRCGGRTSYVPSVSSSKGRRGGAFQSKSEQYYGGEPEMLPYGMMEENMARESMKPMSKAEMRREKEAFMKKKGFSMDLPMNSNDLPMNSMGVPASGGKKKSSARGAIVKKVMREKGLSLPQASKYVKEHGLY